MGVLPYDGSFIYIDGDRTAIFTSEGGEEDRPFNHGTANPSPVAKTGASRQHGDGSTYELAASSSPPG